MVRKKKELFNFECEKCGYVPEPDKEKSNENWNVVMLTCPKCGGRIQMTLNE
jgi:predicted RNA-binding Zn-ribbon protein involved in translation (DUF1610 family)